MNRQALGKNVLSLAMYRPNENQRFITGNDLW